MRKEKILKRERINKALDRLFDYPLTIVSATMGYGKTTSVGSYLEGKRVQTAWVSLLGSDAMEAVFWHKLSKAVEGLFPKIGEKLRRLGFPLDAQQRYEVIDVIWEMNDGNEIVLVIDDYHVIDDNRQVGNLIELIVHEEIPNLHIVLTTRTRPKFNHINLLSKGLCYYIDTDTLAFTMEELVEYFALVDCQAVSGDMKKIYNYTKGWISAVYLLMLGLKQGLPVNEVSNINLLVEDNLFGNLSSETKDILLRLSVLDSFTIQQAVIVIGDPKVTQIISFLEEKNAFIGYDGLNGTYKLHNVLLDFLRDKLAVSGMDVSNICYRAGKWCLDHGEINTALGYYYRADKIQELFEYLNSKNLIDIGYLGYELMQKIYSELPHDLCVKYPFTFLQMARNFIISGYADAVKQGMEIVKMMKDYYLKSHELPENLRNKVLGELEVVTIFMVFNDAKKW